MNRWKNVWCAGCLMVGVSCAAQEAGTFQLHVDSRLIDSTVLVRDSHGAVVTGIPQTAFHIEEDGRPQTLRYFASQRELPLSIGLIVDASDSQETFVKEHEKEIEGFLRELMAPGDHAFAVCFGNHLRLTTDWTGDAKTVVESVHAFNEGERNYPELGPKEDRELGTALYDAVYFPVAERMAAEHGRRRVLVIFSDGEENSSEHDLVDAITEAQSADTLVYALRTTEKRKGGMNARDRYGMRVLDHLTEATGGRTFDVAAQSAKEIFAEMAKELKSLYEVGYYSSNAVRDRKFRKVTITVDGEGMTVQSRAGYVPR